MDEKQILKEIAYYSRFINEHKAAAAASDKYKYVKKCEAPLPVIPPSTKVLINPNFKRSVHINPHFNKNTKIHINPKVLTNFSSVNTQTGPNEPHTISIQFAPNAPHIPRTVSRLAPQVSKVPKIAPHLNPKILHPQLLVQFCPQTNNVRTVSQLEAKMIVPPPFRPHVSSNMYSSPQTATVPPQIMSHSRFTLNLNNRKRRVSIHSKYKIVKSSVLTNAAKSPPLKPAVLKNKYKIDRRSIPTIFNKSTIKKKMIQSGISDLVRNKLFRNRTWKSVTKMNHSKIANISGVLYKKTKNKLQKIQTIIPNQNNTTNKSVKRYLLSSKGQKYILGSDKKTLRLLPNQSINNRTTNYRRISVKGITYIQKTSNTYIRAKTVSPESLKKNKQNLRRKNNQPCPVYRRFGKCRRKESGRCNFLHNPNQIFLCKKFLQGACLEEKCALSHKVSLEKMPTCKYFLEGCCVRSDCGYLHVKINPKADICRKFLEGFCQEGAQCYKRHQFLCPNFERDQKCPRRKCQYPHKPKTTCNLPIPKTNQLISKLPKYEHLNANAPKTQNSDSPPDSDPNTVQMSEVIEPTRYYAEVPITDNGESPSAPGDKLEAQVSELAPKSPLIDNIDNELSKRPQLGTLPQFIPFE